MPHAPSVVWLQLQQWSTTFLPYIREMGNVLKQLLKMLLLTLYCLDLPLANGHKAVDLSYSFDENTAFWPISIPFRFTKQTADYNRGFWYALNEFKTSEHCGTHLDAPYHFNKQGWKVADIPLNRLLTTGVLLNVSGETNGNCSYKLPVSALTQWQEKHGPFPDRSVVLVNFGWSSKYDNKTEYFGPTAKLCFPGVSKEAAQWIVNSKKIVGVGVDSPSVDQGEDVAAHIELHSNSIYHLENLALKQPLPVFFKLIVLPMKIAQGTGAPCRVIALV